MKTVLFVPGFRETLTTRNYAATLQAIEQKGYATRFVPIDWKYTTIEEWVAQLQHVYAEYDPKKTILAGFSFGAMTAYVAATQRMPSELWLFSLSPYFEEDLVSMKASWLAICGKRRIAAFSRLQFAQLALQTVCPTLVIYGEQEGNVYPRLKLAAERAHKLIANNRMFVVAGCHHDVADQSYIDLIAASI